MMVCLCIKTRFYKEEESYSNIAFGQQRICIKSHFFANG